MKYKTTYCSHEALEKKLNDASQEGWHLLQILAHEQKLITIIFYQDEFRKQQEMLAEAIDEPKDVLEEHVTSPSSPWWKFR